MLLVGVCEVWVVIDDECIVLVLVGLDGVCVVMIVVDYMLGIDCLVECVF